MINRNHRIDVVKFIGAVSVVIIHVTAKFPEENIATVSNYFWWRSVLNFAVPFFFAVSGYLFAVKNSSVTDCLKMARKLFLIYAIATGIYILFRISLISMMTVVEGGDLNANIMLLLRTFSFSKFIAGDMVADLLWYLMAGCIAMLFVSGCIKLKIAPIFILLFGFMVYALSIFKWFDFFGTIGTGGGFPKGLCYVALGYFLGMEGMVRKNIVYVITTMLIYICTCCYIDPKGFHYSQFVLIILTAELVMYLAKSNGKQSVCSYLGRKYTLPIYVFHGLGILIVPKFIEMTSLNALYRNPFFYVAETTVLVLMGVVLEKYVLSLQKISI